MLFKSNLLVFVYLSGASTALPIRREVPQGVSYKSIYYVLSIGLMNF